VLRHSRPDVVIGIGAAALRRAEAGRNAAGDQPHSGPWALRVLTPTIELPQSMHPTLNCRAWTSSRSSTRPVKAEAMSAHGCFTWTFDADSKPATTSRRVRGRDHSLRKSAFDGCLMSDDVSMNALSGEFRHKGPRCNFCAAGMRCHVWQLQWVIAAEMASCGFQNGSRRFSAVMACVVQRRRHGAFRPPMTATTPALREEFEGADGRL